MSNPFTIRIFVPEGDPEGLRIIDRQSSPSKFFAFPRNKWDQIKNKPEMTSAGIYILSGYPEGQTSELPTIYVGQADTIKNRIEQHIKHKIFWDKAVVFVSDKINSTHAKWLEHKLIERLIQVNRSIVENGNSPQEPTISEAEQAEMQVFLTEIYQTLPLVGLRSFEISTVVAAPKHGDTLKLIDSRDTIIVPAQEEGFNRVFINENSWYAIRISGGMLENIKYIAGYQTAPISAITHYAEVKNIEPYGEDGKYKVNFTGKAVKIDNPIENDLQSGALQGPRYTSFHKLTHAKKMSELF